LSFGGEKFFGAFVEMPLSHYTVLLLVNRKKVDGKIIFMQILSIFHGGFSGIGVANIKERIRLYYGDAGKVICESDGKSFTKISIVLPAEVMP